MKHLLLFFLFSGSLDSFSQVRATTLPGIGVLAPIDSPVKPDTIRAIILVTTSANGFGRSRMGYVVIELGKVPVYLDCRKRELKLPQVGWGYREVGGEK